MGNKVNRYTLDNGLIVLTLNKKNTKKAALLLGVKVGSVNENPTISGASHFNEHMAFQSNLSRTTKQISLDLEQFGSNTNAYTSEEITCYHTIIQKAGIPTVIEIFSQMINNFAYNENDFQKEKEVILSELRSDIENPERYCCSYLFFPRIFTDTRYKNSIIGDIDSLTNMTNEQLINFKAEYYLPNNMVFVAVGNFDEEGLLSDLKNHFGKMEPGKVPILESRLDLLTPDIKYFEEREDLDSSYLLMGYRVCSAKSEDILKLKLLNCILGGCTSSRIYSVLRDEMGLAYTVGSGVDTYIDIGAFYAVIFGCSPDRLNEGRDRLLEIFYDVKTRLVEDNELEKVKNIILSDYYDLLDSKEQLANNLLNKKIRGLPYEDIFNLEKRLKSITKKDIREVANKYLTGNYTLTALVPKGFKPK